MCVCARGRRGFTLIELLVVIAIIAILAAVLFPLLERAKEAGLRASCSSQMQQIAKALVAYADDYNGRLPWAYGHIPTSAAPPPGIQFISRVLYTYQGKKDGIWVCPSTPYKADDPVLWGYRYYYSQFMTYNVTSLTGVDDVASIAGKLIARPNFEGMRDPDDSGKYGNWNNTRISRIPIIWDRRKQNWDAKNGRMGAEYRLMHNDGWNVLFVDGHVKYFTEKSRQRAYLPE